MNVKNKKLLWGIGLAGVAGIILFLVFRKKNGSSVKTPPESEPITDPPEVNEPPYIDNPNPTTEEPINSPQPEPGPITVKPVGPNPLDPSPEPQKGGYYAVVKKDTMYGINERAGFAKGQELKQAYKAMLTDVKNAWIGKKTDNQGNEVLRFNKRFAAVQGYEDKPWAWGTSYVPNTPGKWPVVRVPLDGELS